MRARAEEIEELTAAIGEERILERCGNALTSQSVGPKILWLKRNRPEIFAKAAKILTSTTYLVQRLTGECVIDHYSAANFSPALRRRRAGLERPSSRPTSSPLERLPELCWTTDIAGTVTANAARGDRPRRGHAGHRRHDRCGRGGAQRRRARPGDMMVMYGSTIFIIMLTEEPGRAMRGSGTRRGCSRASTRRWPGSRPAAR